MKTLNLTNLAKLALGLLVVLSVACDKKGGDSTPVGATANYAYVNGSCHDTTTNTAVAANLCANVLINGAYRYDGATCRDTAGNVVTTTLCTQGIYTTGVNSQYHLNGVTCVDINNNPVAQTLCTQMGVNTQYQILGGNCIYTYTGQAVSYQYCSGVAGYNPNMCNGIFLKYLGYGMTSYLYCQGSNCSGQTLIEYTTGIQKVCP